MPVNWIIYERSFKLEELSQVQKESEKKDSNLKSALERLKESDFALQRALRYRKRALEKCREAESTIQCDHDEEKMAREMVDGLLSEMKKEKVVSRCEMNQLRNDRDEVPKWLKEYRSEKQSDIDLSRGSTMCRATKIANRARRPVSFGG